MNIIIQDCKGMINFRPDTTRDREGRNLFAPEFVTGYGYAPVLFAHVCKVGKCVGAKFAARYYNAVNYGILLYPETQTGTMTIMDRTSLLPAPMYDKAVMETGTEVFEVRHNGETLYSTTTAGGTELIEKAVLNASKYMLLRMGDLIAVELSPVTSLPLAQNPNSQSGLKEYKVMEPKHHLTASFCGNALFDFYIK